MKIQSKVFSTIVGIAVVSTLFTGCSNETASKKADSSKSSNWCDNLAKGVDNAIKNPKSVKTPDFNKLFDKAKSYADSPQSDITVVEAYLNRMAKIASSKNSAKVKAEKTGNLLAASGTSLLFAANNLRKQCNIQIPTF